MQDELRRVAPRVTIVVSPHFEDDDLDRARTEFEAEHPDGDPADVARRTLLAMLFPPPHPYSTRTDLVSARDVAKLRRDALRSFRDMFLTTDHVTCALRITTSPRSRCSRPRRAAGCRAA